MPPAVAASAAVERNVMSLPLEHLVVDRLLDVRLVVVAERLHAAGALAAPAASRVGRRARALVAGSSPTSSVASHAVTCDEQVVPGLGRGAGALACCTESVPSPGPSRYVPGWTHAGAYIAASHLTPETDAWQ